LNVFTKLFSRTKQPRFNSGFNVSGSVPPDRNLEGYLRAYGEIGWLHAVVFRIALGCSEVKWQLNNATNPDKPTKVAKHPILSLLNTVNPFQTSNEFIAEIWIPNPLKMSVVPDAQKFIRGYVYGTGPDAIPFAVDEVIHFKYPSPLNQYRGMGPAQSISVDLDAELYSGQWNRQFFFNSARPDGVIEFDFNLSDDQFAKLKTQWGEKYKGVSKAHQVALLEGGGKYKQIQNSVKDMDFAQLKRLNRDVILGVYGMPLSVMGISENVNKANAEAGDYTFARWIVKPRLDWKTAKLQEQLIPKFRNSKNLQLGFEEVVPETIEQKRDLAESGMRAGYLTINEARKMQKLDPLPHGDVLLVPLNLMPMDITKPLEQPEPVQGLAQNEEATEEPNPKGEAEGKALSADHKLAHWNAYAARTANEEAAFKRVFTQVFNTQKDAVIAHMLYSGKLPNDLNDDLTARFFKPIIELSYYNAFEGAVKQLDDVAKQWILTRSLSLAKMLNTTTMEAIRLALAEGFTAGESIQKLTKRIEQYFDGNSKMRAERVARTEVITASNEGALHRYESEGVTKVEFYPAPDACQECMDLVGEYLVSQAHGIITVHPNCRCTWLLRVRIVG
jgi:SPP1 gp7 family putative phage head morphogenesis protein